MNKLTQVLVSILIVGCAHKSHHQEVVQFPYSEDLLKSIQGEVARAPASIDELENLEEKSSRRIYFSALYHQYLTLGRHLGNTESINSCPQFHHDKIETDNHYTPKLFVAKESNVEIEGKAYFPELVFNKEFSLSHYHSNVKTEIETLCEEGTSDNYYKFDNLVTHFSNKKSFHMRPQAMGSVLKIPVFANYYLVRMLKGHHSDMIHPEEKRVIELTRTSWFEKYVDEASRLRSRFTKNKMVLR